MTENDMGKVVVDEAVKVHRELGPGLLGKVHAKQVFTHLKVKGLKLGFVLNFGANLMKDGIERVVDESLGVFASLRETRSGFEPRGAANAAPPHR